VSVNKYRKHVLVVPEDDAIRQIANGFLLDPSVQTSKVQVLPVAGGWQQVQDDIGGYAGTMTKYPHTNLLLLIDCDKQRDRIQQMRSLVPHEYSDRVFILGIESEAEDLKRALGVSFEDIGKGLASDCRDDTNKLWGHKLLQDNATEVSRLREYVYPILFDHD
jgi:hypothetical protein